MTWLSRTGHTSWLELDKLLWFSAACSFYIRGSRSFHIRWTIVMNLGKAFSCGQRRHDAAGKWRMEFEFQTMKRCTVYVCYDIHKLHDFHGHSFKVFSTTLQEFTTSHAFAVCRRLLALKGSSVVLSRLPVSRLLLVSWDHQRRTHTLTAKVTANRSTTATTLCQATEVEQEQNNMTWTTHINKRCRPILP